MIINHNQKRAKGKSDIKTQKTNSTSSFIKCHCVSTTEYGIYRVILLSYFHRSFYFSAYTTLVTFPNMMSELESMAAIRPNGLHSSNGCTTMGIFGANTTSA